MSKPAKKNASLSAKELEDLVIENDAGARRPDSKFEMGALIGIALLWSLFQLWIASPLQFTFVSWFNSFDLHIFGKEIFLKVFNNTETRSIHLAFAVLLAYMAYPARKKSPRHYIPKLDWIMGIVGALCAAYLYIAYEELSTRSGLPIQQDIIVASVGMILLLEATRRALGPPLLVIAIIFLIYTFAGSLDFIPDLIKHKGQSLSKVASHQWLTTEGVFGIALGVSTSFVFLFVLFGSLLDKAGAGNYFIKVAFSLLGHLRGGPAKAAVLSSGMTGLISGSSIANTVTTGTFTIPLMKRVGFSGSKAGAIEVASSVNGQIMPPVMGAAAFLMVEYVGISYIEVIKHAFLPAVISYIALLYIVHLEALKNDMKALPKPIVTTLKQKLLSYGIITASVLILSGIIYFAIGWLKTVFGESAGYVLTTGIIVAYVLAIKYSSKLPDLEADDPNSPVVELPETAPTVKSGLYYILPIVVLVWFLMIERTSPGLSAFWATLLMMFIICTQGALKAFFRNTGEYKKALNKGMLDLLDGLVTGARNMIGIGVATAAAGVIVGTVSLTGVGQVLTDVVEAIAGGSIILILLLTALICIVLGMGLPTTANYIVVASLMAGVIQQLGAQNGLVVPLIAIHLFVFYFGIMADVTPPVGLASFAAAAISGADPIRTGLQAFIYSLRTATLPFFFIFNTELIMVGVDTIEAAVWVFIKATVAILVFSAALQGYFIVRSKLYESALLLIAAVTLFVPQLWINLIFPAYEEVERTELFKVVEEAKEGELVKITVRGEDFERNFKQFETFIDPVPGKSSREILEDFGIIVAEHSGKLVIEDVVFNSTAENAGIDFDFEIIKVELPQKQPEHAFMYIIAVISTAIVFMSQNVRRKQQKALKA